MNQQPHSNKANLIFFGTPDYAVPTLQALLSASRDYCLKAVVTQPDRPAGRGKALRPAPVKEMAEKAGLPVFTPNSLKKELGQFMSSLRQFGEIDLGVVIAFGQILPQELLAYPRRGCVNLHASLLPRWRGAAPLQRALLAGDQETGVCLMQMEAGLDSGPVYAQRLIPLTPKMTYGELHSIAAIKSAELLLQELPQLLRGELTARPQPQIGITYAEKISCQDAAIDWSKAASEIERQVRALNPHPGAVTMLQEKRLKILQARLKQERPQDSKLPPGSISFVDKENCEVKCGNGCLALKEVQLEGRRVMSIAEFLRGAALETGVQLGGCDTAS